MIRIRSGGGPVAGLVVGEVRAAPDDSAGAAGCFALVLPAVWGAAGAHVEDRLPARPAGEPRASGSSPASSSSRSAPVWSSASGRGCTRELRRVREGRRRRPAGAAAAAAARARRARTSPRASSPQTAAPRSAVICTRSWPPRTASGSSSGDVRGHGLRRDRDGRRGPRQLPGGRPRRARTGRCTAAVGPGDASGICGSGRGTSTRRPAGGEPDSPVAEEFVTVLLLEIGRGRRAYWPSTAVTHGRTGCCRRAANRCACARPAAAARARSRCRPSCPPPLRPTAARRGAVPAHGRGGGRP